jgi:arylsulfatase A-like enzyme
MARWYAGVDFPPPQNETDLPRAEHNAVRANYAAMIENIDRWVGRLIAEVRQRGEAEDTLVVFASDHGEMLGDHGRWGKVVPFQPSLAVPLIIAGRGVGAGRIHDGPATILDLAATFLDFAAAQPLSAAESRSLRPLLEGRGNNARGHVLSALDDWRAVYDGRFKLIENFEGKSWLFDLQSDPGETRNRAHDLVEEVDRLHSIFKTH